MRGWTQEKAAAELEPYLGSKLSSASFSAIERSFAGGRIRQFTADEILAMSRGFNLPIGWFFTPPHADSEIAVSTPDKPNGSPSMLLIDAVLGTPETLRPWEEQLAIWPSMYRRGTVTADGKIEDRGAEMPDVHQRLDSLLKARTSMRIGELFGDTSKARDVLSSMVELLDELDDVVEPPD